MVGRTGLALALGCGMAIVACGELQKKKGAETAAAGEGGQGGAGVVAQGGDVTVLAGESAGGEPSMSGFGGVESGTAGQAGELGVAGLGEAGGPNLPAVTANDCLLEPFEISLELASACLMVDQCGFLSSEDLPMCLFAFNDLSLPDSFVGSRAGRCALEATTCIEVRDCLDFGSRPATVGACTTPNSTTCVGDVLTFCDGGWRRFETDCTALGLRCNTAEDDFAVKQPGCYPENCAAYGDYFRQFCEAETLVVDLPVAGPADERAQARLSCPSFGYSACADSHCVP